MSDAVDAARFRYLQKLIVTVFDEDNCLVFGFDTEELSRVRFIGTPSFAQVIDTLMANKAKTDTPAH